MTRIGLIIGIVGAVVVAAACPARAAYQQNNYFSNPLCHGGTLTMAVVTTVSSCVDTGCRTTTDGQGAWITCPATIEGYLATGTYVRLSAPDGGGSNCSATPLTEIFAAQAHCFDDPSNNKSLKYLCTDRNETYQMVQCQGLGCETNCSTTEHTRSCGGSVCVVSTNPAEQYPRPSNGASIAIGVIVSTAVIVIIGSALYIFFGLHRRIGYNTIQDENNNDDRIRPYDQHEQL